jgi:hypothetical protein
VNFGFLLIPTCVVDELVDTGRDLIPDVLEVNVYGFRPEVILPHKPLSPEIDIDDDGDDDDCNVSKISLG